MNKEVTLKSIFTLVLRNRRSLVYGQLVTLIAILVSVPIPLLLPILVDEVLLDKPGYVVNSINFFIESTTAFYYILIVTLGVIFLRVFYYLLGVYLTKVFTFIAKFVSFEIRQKLLEHLKIVSMNEYETLGSGTITSNLVTDVNTLESFIMNASSKMLSSILTLLAVGIVLLAIEPILGLMILTIQPMMMFLSRKMSKRVGGLKTKENEAIANFQEDVSETLELFGQIKASNQENYFFSRAKEFAKKVQTTSNEFGYKNVAYEKLSGTLFLVMFELIRASGLLLVAYSDLSIGMMLAMFGYIWFIMTPVQELISLQYSLASAKAALERINKVLLLETEQSADEELGEHAVNIRLQNVHFAYSNEKKILNDISLEIKAGEKVALIGASGSGKTTLAQLISGFYEKSFGDIFYNGISTEILNKSSLRSKIFLVLQMPILFNASLRFNITMGDENIRDETIYQALKTAQLDVMLAEMPNGLESIVGRHGIRLSGGQRQRLSIARMIVANPSVVIFDESTSALDVHTEMKLQAALEPILKEKTVITIAHRLSTVKNADTIYVLENGQIVQRGTHEELEDEEGHYNEFVKRQLI
ncbi:MAG: ABC transporter ATP-binding protein [Campylobacterales bacterium]|nr:ABC transporter ATP-binding protein [Campylobacterales bacterium]